MLIWWLNQKDCENIENILDLPNKLPEWLHNQFDSRCGRAGRGRLWVDEQFSGACVDPWPDTPLAKTLGDDYGGIVVSDALQTELHQLPGIITDLQLNRLN